MGVFASLAKTFSPLSPHLFTLLNKVPRGCIRPSCYNPIKLTPPSILFKGLSTIKRGCQNFRVRFAQPPKQNLVNATAKIQLRLFLVENMQNTNVNIMI